MPEVSDSVKRTLSGDCKAEVKLKVVGDDGDRNLAVLEALEDATEATLDEHDDQTRLGHHAED